MVTIKTPEEIKVLREGGRILANILKTLSKEAKVGTSTLKLNELAIKLARDAGAEPAFLDYYPSGADRPYPAGVCISVNDEIVHGIPNEDPKILKDGDIVSIDMGIIYQGLITDSAITVGVGKLDEVSKELIEVTRNALDVGIKSARGGNTVGDIGFAISEYVRPYGFGIVEELCGHGVGYKVHEDPYVPNFGKKGSGEKLKKGMVIAIEPMVNEGTKKIKLAKDGWTYKTADGKRSAHFEHTIVITEEGSDILTVI